MTAPKVTELTKFDPIEAGLKGLEEKFTWPEEKLDAMLAHVDEQEVVKGAKKTLTSTRTALTKAKNDAKKPYLDAGKVIEAKFKEIAKRIADIEAPIDAAIKRRKDADDNAAKDAQAERIAELEAQLEAQSEALKENDVKVAEFEEKQVTLTLTDKHYPILRELLGRKAFKELQYDADGNSYTLQVTVRRSELDKE